MSDTLVTGALVEGRYQLDHRLGVGSFGDVWRARDTRLAGRSVAIKFLRAEHLERPDLIARFDAEADALALMQHPNVVGVTDRGQWQGLRYLVTEFVEGVSLAEWLKRHKTAGTMTDVSTVLGLMDQICAALAAAHALRDPGPIVHRDLKPENVLLRELPSGELVVKVLDFGVAQLGGRTGTNTGMLLGTPIYMAPEQAMGRSTNIGPWTDVFALGVLCVEMLTLRAKIGEDETWWGMVMLDGGKVRALLGGLRVDVLPAVWDVLARALHPRGAERYPDATALRRALRAAADPASATTTTPPGGIDARPSVTGITPAVASAIAPTAPIATLAARPSARGTPLPGHDANARPDAHEPPSPPRARRRGPARSRAPAIAVSLLAVALLAGIGVLATRSAVGPLFGAGPPDAGAIAAGIDAAAPAVVASARDAGTRATGRNGRVVLGPAAPDASTNVATSAPPLVPATGAVDAEAPAVTVPASGATEPAPLETDRDALSFVRRWAYAVTVGRGRAPLEPYYTPHPRFRRTGRGASPLTIRNYWRRHFASRGTFAVDPRRSTVQLEAVGAEPGALAVCGALPGADGPIVKVRAWATELLPERNLEIGCQRLEGIYLLRMRRVAGRLRICYETWSTREGLCASCPRAPACRNLDDGN